MTPLIKKIFLSLMITLFFQGIVKAQPANDLCANATLLTSGITCNNTPGTLVAATYTAGPAACGAATATDVWYKFVAKSEYPTVTLSNVGANLATASPRIQILSGTCASFTVNICGTTLSTTPVTPLIIGDTYYIRIGKNTTTSTASGTWGFNICVTDPVGSAMNEVFKQTTLVPQVSGLNDPWEITYGPDDSLWITIAKDYKVIKMHPTDGGSRTVLDISPGATGYLTATEHTNYNRLAWTTSGSVPWPQGGLMGLALHPDFMNAATKFVYLGYVRSQGSVPTDGTGQYYTNFLVRFTFNTTSGRLENPVTLCDTLPGSKDHNSGRLIIAPISGVNYLFYSSGDMGSGQYENITRPVKVQNIACYEGKILRFNLEEDADAVQNIGVRNANYNRWIPSGAGAAANPYNTYLGTQSAVWNTGHRNVQGFASANLGGTDYLFASSHGPYSDDEINIMEAGKNYGHPYVIGMSTDGNYDGARAGPSTGSLPLLTKGEVFYADSLNNLPYGTGYKDPLYSFYGVAKGSTTVCSSPNQYYIQDIYRNCAGTGTNNFWKSEAPSGLGIYTGAVIPGWKNSFLLASLKWGRVARTKLNSSYTGLTTVDGVVDTMPYFESRNRYRDMAISPNGKDLFIIMDKSLSTSGPSQDNPVALNCTGCVVKYTFLGYHDNAGASTINTSIPIAPGLNNQLTTGTPTTINSVDNNNLWVPITDSLGNIIAEIDANNNNLGNITASLYKNSGAIRTTAGGTPYLDRSITINVSNPPGTPVNVRLYLTAAELATLIGAPASGVSSITNVFIYKNTDANGTALTAAPLTITPTARTLFGSNYVITASISGFSTFYFAGPSFVLPVDMLTLSGKYADQSIALQWKTENESNTSHFVIEKSSNGLNFKSIGTVAASGNTSIITNYSYKDNDLTNDYTPYLYYRLKMFDVNGTYKYSNRISVSLPSLTGTVTISPNPATNEMKAFVVSPADCKADWRIIDNAGRIILYGNASMKKGSNQLSIDISKIAAGTYYLQVTGSNIECKTRFQKL
jgi:trimeric autotransporter adhesin